MAHSENKKTQDTKADEPLRRRLVEFVEKHGEKKAIELLVMSRQTFARLIGGLSVHRATMRDARAQLDKLAPVDATDTTQGGNNDA